MTTSIRRLLSISLAFLCLADTAQADVILEPDPVPPAPTEFATINGTVGLQGYPIASGSVYLNMPGYSKSASVGSNGQFTIQAAAGGSYNLSVSTQTSGYSAYFNASQSNAPALAAGAIHTVDFTSRAGLIHGEVSVSGGRLTNISVYGSTTDPVRAVTFSAGGWATLTQQETISAVTVPAPVGAAVSAYGSATAINDNGCTVSRSLPPRTVAVSEALTTDVAWTIDVSGVTCDKGNLQGAVSITGLPAGTVTGGSVSIYGAESRSQSLGTGGTYNFTDLRAGSYTLNAYSNLAAPYNYYRHPTASTRGIGRADHGEGFSRLCRPGKGNGATGRPVGSLSRQQRLCKRFRRERRIHERGRRRCGDAAYRRLRPRVRERRVAHQYL